MDMGGGLGVDYEGTRSRGFCSINYGLDQFAHTLVQPLAEACAEHGLPPPMMITEAGRAMTAHHAVMVVNVSEVERAPEGSVPAPQAGEPAVLRHLREIHAELDERPPLELYHEAQQALAEGQALYALGQLDAGAARRARRPVLRHRAPRARRASPARRRSHREVLDELNERLVDKYFVNFSVFESMPDVWAIDQVFPIVPIARLDEEPDRRGVIADLTCDSDGRIDTYVGAGVLDTSLPLHRRERARAIASASSWSAPTRRRWATSTTCSATPTPPTCALDARRRLHAAAPAPRRHHRRDARLRRLRPRRPARRRTATRSSAAGLPRRRGGRCMLARWKPA